MIAYVELLKKISAAGKKLYNRVKDKNKNNLHYTLHPLSSLS